MTLFFCFSKMFWKFSLVTFGANFYSIRQLSPQFYPLNTMINLLTAFRDNTLDKLINEGQKDRVVPILLLQNIFFSDAEFHEHSLKSLEGVDLLIFFKIKFNVDEFVRIRREFWDFYVSFFLLRKFQDTVWWRIFQRFRSEGFRRSVDRFARLVTGFSLGWVEGFLLFSLIIWFLLVFGSGGEPTLAEDGFFGNVKFSFAEWLGSCN